MRHISVVRQITDCATQPSAEEFQKEITLIDGPSPYFFVRSMICLVDINMFARFDEIPAMTLQDIKETKRYWGTHKQCENSRHNVKNVYRP